MVSGMELAPGNYPLLSARLIEAPNRLWAIPVLGIVVKGLMLIPVAIWLYILSLVAVGAYLINSLVVLFTGEYSEPAYTLVLGLLRIEVKTAFFMIGLTDRYPGFSLEIPPDYEFAFDMPMPSSPSRAFAIPILGGLIRYVLLIPILIWTQILSAGAFLAMIVASIPVVTAGRYPESLYELLRDAIRVGMSINCYFLGLSDSYPSFSISMNNAGVKWVFIVLGALLFFLQIIGQIAQTASQAQR